MHLPIASACCDSVDAKFNMGLEIVGLTRLSRLSSSPVVFSSAMAERQSSIALRHLIYAFSRRDPISTTELLITVPANCCKFV